MDLIRQRRSTFSRVAEAVPQTDRSIYTDEGRETRRRRGWIVARSGGNISDFAHVEGVKSQTMVQWLKTHDIELHRVFGDASHPMILPAHKRLERLIAVRDGRAKGLRTSQIAGRLGLTPNRLRFWLKRWAPDGVDMAIEDESEGVFYHD